MTVSELHLQVLYEIAMSIGNSLDLKKMLQESLSSYLRKFNLAAGVVLQGKFNDDHLHLEPVFAIPRMIHKNEAYLAAMAHIPAQVPKDRMEEKMRLLPLTGCHDSMHYHIMELPGFGLLILLKSRAPMDTYLLKTLSRLNKKLSIACQTCLRKGRIEQMAKDLKRENKTRKNAEMALAEAHERLLMVLNSIDVIIYAADIDNHKVVFMNRHAETLFGNGLIGRSCFKVMRGEPKPCAHCANSSLLDASGLPTGKLVWEDRNPITRRWYIHQARAIKWIDGRWVRLQFSTDITQFKQMEQERLKEAHLQQTQRLEALGILAGGVAHEYNNLLMSMLGNLSLVNYKIEPGNPLQRNLKKIETSIRAAANLTDQLLGYAQKGRYENTNLQLNTLVRATVGEFSAGHESIRLHMDLAKNLDPVEADQRQIEHVLWNLLSNAADAMSDGGDLYIATRNVKRRDLRNKPYVLDKNDYIELLVRDTGVGMPPEVREHIFDPFYTTKPMIVGKGAGLGMAATYGIVKSHEGFIEVTSEEGKGSEFLVYLPSDSESLHGSDATGNGSPSGKTVLWVDDDKTSLEIGTQILEHLGCQVIEARSGMEAVTQYQKDHKKIDVVILDMVMPDMSGIETFEQIKASFPEAKILMASGYILDAEARRMLEHGAEGFVKKPFAIEELNQTLEKVMG